MNRIEALRHLVERINSADLQGLTDLYEDLIGFDPVAVGVPVVSTVLREDLLDHVKEECYEMGIHVSEVGL